jgi:CBS domain-containing protein
VKTVRDLLRDKPGEVWRMRPEATVFEALQSMAEKNVGALVVMEGEVVVGVISERDYARKTILQGKSSKETPVRDIMTADVYFIRPDDDVEQCMALMTEKRIRHLPVMEGGRLVGIISIGDIVKGVISDREFVIEQLEGYITGRR